MTTLKYTTPLNFNRFILADSEIPMLVPGETPSRENVGTGDSSTTVFYFDQKYLVEDSEVLYTGSLAESGATTLLVRDVDYSVDYDKSKLTLTASGVVAVGTTSIFAEYVWNKFGIKNTFINDVLLNAESEVDRRVNTIFVDGTSSSPVYSGVTDEIHVGKGYWNRVYNSDFYPLCDTSESVSGAVSVGATTISVSSSTNGFPYSGVLGIGTNKVLYTGKTSTSFTGVTGVSTVISSGTTIVPFVMERSLTTQGTEPTWEVLSYASDYDCDPLTGSFKLNGNSVVGVVLYDTFMPPEKTWNRVRLSYSYGYDTIPKDIVRVVHLLAAKELFNSQVLNALSRGTNGFETGSSESTDRWIDKTIEDYKCWLISNLNGK